MQYLLLQLLAKSTKGSEFQSSKMFCFVFLSTQHPILELPHLSNLHTLTPEHNNSTQFSSIYIPSNPNTNQLKVLYIVKTLQRDSVHEHLCSILICLYSSVTAVGFLRHQRLRTREHNLSNPSGDKTPLGCERCGSPITQQNQEEGI